jgi:Protein of unknown function (DUF4054)
MEQLISDSDVQAIFPTSFSTQPFIQAAVVVTDALLAESGYSDETLREIQRWLAAHFASGRQQGIKSESYEGLSVSYMTATLGEGLKGTTYGQTALALDTKGFLSGVAKRRATVTVH